LKLFCAAHCSDHHFVGAREQQVIVESLEARRDLRPEPREPGIGRVARGGGRLEPASVPMHVDDDI
jgi:hypothetical protein